MKRFWDKVDKSSDCWEWLAGKVPSGYGAFLFNGKLQGAHRVSFQLTHGPIPEGDYYGTAGVLHRCDNPSCVNPDHLFLGSPSDNMRDKVEKGRDNARKGSDHPNAQLCDLDVWLIKNIEGQTTRVIADWFGIAPANVYGIRSGRIWSHIL